jgi:hypothetical protein
MVECKNCHSARVIKSGRRNIESVLELLNRQIPLWVRNPKDSFWCTVLSSVFHAAQS